MCLQPPTLPTKQQKFDNDYCKQRLSVIRSSKPAAANGPNSEYSLSGEALINLIPSMGVATLDEGAWNENFPENGSAQITASSRPPGVSRRFGSYAAT